MGQLTNQYVSSSYQGLLKMTDSSQGLTNTLQTIQTGDGDNSPLQMSLTEVNISGSFFINNVPITNGTNGTSGTSGVNGSSGSSGTSGQSGSNGTSGSSGTSGIGVSGTSGSSGSSGTSGGTGSSGSSGTSGINGSNGSSGTSGVAGSSGTSGSNGSSGTSGSNGSSGTSGQAGTSGTSGTSFESPYTGDIIVTGSIDITGNYLINGAPIPTGSGGGDRNGLITTGSVSSTQEITGSLILGNTVISGSLIGNAINNGLIKIASEARFSSSLQLNITASAPVSSSNLLLNGGGPSNPFLSGSIIISGSNNIITNPYRTVTTAQGTLGYIAGNNNIINSIPLISTSSFLSQNNLSQNNNILNSQVTIDSFASGAIPASVDFNSFSNNNIGGIVLLRHKSGSFSVANNNSQGSIQSFATQSILFPSGAVQGPTINGNVHAGGSTVLSHISSSIIYNQNISDASGLIIRNSATHPAALNGSGSVSVTNNIFGGGTNTLTFSGTGAQNTKGVNNNIIVGNNNELNIISSGSSAFVTNTALFGLGLIVSGTVAGVGSGGSTFVGRWNATGSNQESSNDAVFVVGTGFGAASRRNALRIDNNNNSQFTGSVQISGSLILNGAAVSGDRNGLITTGSIGTSQSITGSLILSSSAVTIIGQPGNSENTLVIQSGSMKMSDVSGSIRIATANNQPQLFFSPSRNVGFFLGQSNMDQVNTQFGITDDSTDNYTMGGNFNNFRTGSNNLMLGVQNISLRSGSNNLIFARGTEYNTGSNNLMLGRGPIGVNECNDYFNLQLPNDGNPIMFKSGSVAPLTISGSVNIEKVMNLQAQNPLPSGNVGDLAVSGSSLYFYNGTWTLIV